MILIRFLLAAIFFIQFFAASLYTRTADYFPLQIGNKWLYDWAAFDGIITWEIIDTLTINNRLYYLLLEEKDTPFWGKDTLLYFYHQDSQNRVWFAHPITFKETLTTRQFNRSPGLIECTYDSVNNLTRVTTLQDTNYTVFTPAGTFYHCYYFNFLLVEIHTDMVDIYAPDVGRVRVLTEGEEYILRGAFVNGVLIGDTTRTIIKKINDINPKANIILYQNYPNPFNPTTTISYDLPLRSHVLLRVYDVQGREVTTLLNGIEQPGNKSVILNADDWSSGIYYYRLQAGDFVQIRKLILLR